MASSSSNAAMYEPCLTVEDDIIIDLDERNKPTHDGFRSNGTTLKVGLVNIDIYFRRKSFTGEYIIKISCAAKNIDPYWMIKLHQTYSMRIDGRNPEEDNFERSTTFTADCKKTVIGPFESDKDTLTKACLKVHLKVVESVAIHPPLAFDFSQCTKLSDASIIVENNKRLYVTKSILAMQSPYFHRVFRSTDEVALPDVRLSDMITFLNMVYPHNSLSQLTLASDKTLHCLERLARLAERLETPAVITMIETDLIRRRIPSLEFADKFHMSRLLSREIKKVRTRNDYRKLRDLNLKDLSDDLRATLLDGAIGKMAYRRPTPGPAAMSPAEALAQFYRSPVIPNPWPMGVRHPAAPLPNIATLGFPLQYAGPGPNPMPPPLPPFLPVLQPAPPRGAAPPAPPRNP